MVLWFSVEELLPQSSPQEAQSLGVQPFFQFVTHLVFSSLCFHYQSILTDNRSEYNGKAKNAGEKTEKMREKKIKKCV